MALENDRLELIVKQIAEAVLASTETIDRLANRVDALVVQVQQQGQQMQQQGYQIFALSDAIQTIADIQKESLQPLIELTQAIQSLVLVSETKEQVIDNITNQQ